MEHKTNKLNIKIIISIVIVSIVIAVGIMMYKYFTLKEELDRYKDAYSRIKEEKLTISGEDIIEQAEFTNEELKEELIKYKNKYEEVSEELAENVKKLEEYRTNLQNTQER